MDSDDAGQPSSPVTPPPAARVDHVRITVEDVNAAETTLPALGCERVHREVVADCSSE